MKKAFLGLSIIAALSACNSTPKSDEAATSSAQTVTAAKGTDYSVDTTNSVIGWRATHKGGLAPRFGTLKVASGDFSIENDAITAGSFTVDLNTLYVDPTSVTEADKKPEELAGHLKSPDFFDVAKYPTVKFAITKVEPYDSTKAKSLLAGATNIVSGNMTIKDSTVNVTFPAKIDVANGKADLQAKFTVDRTSWGLKYGASGTNPADWAISKDIELTLNVSGNTK
ncbi:YceI family protein [Rhizosphaericola mali]|uniref:Type IV secretion system putative lipoprotein virB7 n=1 Tax=Rhizosphaericola mali TaxID=2545455 RepID=A0A5P2G3A0_9BACT|nr:YceI family protein [Rhizosphaericola mali]QES89965.1 YceI family protein [Rhizosphaericola mali]